MAETKAKTSETQGGEEVKNYNLVEILANATKGLERNIVVSEGKIEAYDELLNFLADKEVTVIGKK